MTVIGVPCINRPDLLGEFLRSIDTDWPVLVIDNSTGTEVSAVAWEMDRDVVLMPSNLGVAASWNFLIRTHPAEAWWCIANADTVLGPGDLERLAEEMAKPGPRWVGVNGDWRVFGINAECVQQVGWFDENFVPIYCEDADYERRCELAGVEVYHIPGGARHFGSASISSGFEQANTRTYPANVAYYREKWGGPVRQPVYTSPFNRGGPVSEWSLSLARLRVLAW